MRWVLSAQMEEVHCFVSNRIQYVIIIWFGIGLVGWCNLDTHALWESGHGNHLDMREALISALYMTCGSYVVTHYHCMEMEARDVNYQTSKFWLSCGLIVSEIRIQCSRQPCISAAHEKTNQARYSPLAPTYRHPRKRHNQPFSTDTLVPMQSRYPCT